MIDATLGRAEASLDFEDLNTRDGRCNASVTGVLVLDPFQHYILVTFEGRFSCLSNEMLIFPLKKS